MRKLIFSSLILATVACQESTTPGIAVVNHSASFYQPGTVPPPPLDSGSYSSNEYGTSTRINTTYFFNVPGNSGWLTFQKNQAAGTTVDPNARISYSKGEFSGKGTLSYLVGGGTVSIDLSSVSQKSTFGNSENGYFSLSFTRGTYTAKGKTVPLAGSSSFSMSTKESCVGDRICDIKK